jgi:hypothetical protein
MITAGGGGGKQITNIMVTTNTHDNKPKVTATHTTTNQEEQYCERTSIHQQHTSGPGSTRFEYSQAELDKKNATINSVKK